MPRTDKKKITSIQTKKIPHQTTDTVGKSGRDLYLNIAVGLVTLVAIGLRVVFSYDISAYANFTLFGGITSSEHLHVIKDIITNKTLFETSGSLNYLFGSPDICPTLFDLIMVPFVIIIEHSMSLDVLTSAHIVLSWSGVVFGVLCTIFSYFLGKEILGSRKAGFLTSLFVALCPISIAQSIFSNGTGISFLAFLFIIFTYSVSKGLKAFDNFSKFSDISILFNKNKKSLKYALYSGLILSAITLSWSGSRPIIVTTILCMVALVLTDRFTNRDSRVSALFFSTILLVTVAVSTIYYAATSFSISIFSGIFTLSIFSSTVCLAFSLMQDKPWITTIPTFAIFIFTLFTILYFFEPKYFYDIISGNNTYREIPILIDPNLSLSKIAVFFGPLTMWFPLIMITSMICNIRKGISLTLHTFIIVLLCLTSTSAIKNTELATIFAPTFAISFAYVIILLFTNVDFQSYFKNLKTKRAILVIRRMFKPLPFLSISIILIAICAPNALYAIDASIPNNSDEYNGINLGAIGYNTKTDNDSKEKDVLLEYDGIQKSGVMATWMNHANEAAAFGNFNITVDTRGNGAVATSNILLSKSPSAAMLLHGIQCNGFDKSKNILLNAGMTEAQFNSIKHCFDSPNIKDIKNDEIYDTIRANLSDESISYITAENILVDNFSELELSKLYRKLCDTCGESIEYIMVTSDMLPIHLRPNSNFASLAYYSGYTVNNGAIPQFFSGNSALSPTGIYDYTDAMYNTTIWKAYIGLSPKEVGKITPNEYLASLMLSDGTYKANPGHGLFNYTIDSNHWYVMYNNNPDATDSSNGWVKMLAKEAQKKQRFEGGLINYLSGFPVILKYSPTSDSLHSVSGHVEMSGIPVQGIHVEVLDANRTTCSYDYTDLNGKYEVTADKNQRIIFSIPTNTTGVKNIIATKAYNEDLSNLDITIPKTSFSGRIINSNNEPFRIISPLNMTMSGQNTGSSLSTVLNCDSHFSFDSIIPDTYYITIANENNSKIYAAQYYDVIAGVDNKDIDIKIDTCRVYIDTINDAGVSVSGDTIILTEKCGAMFEGTSSSGIAIIDVIPGVYTCNANHNKIVTFPVSTISNDTSAIARLHDSKQITIKDLDDKTTFIYSKGYLKLCTDNIVSVPLGSGNTATYTLYSATESNAGIFKINEDTEFDLSSVSNTPSAKVSGVLRDSSNNEVSGTIVFIRDEMEVPVSSNSKGFYEILLPNGTYSIYASHGSEVKILSNFVTVKSNAISNKDIQLSSGTEVKGHTYWNNVSQSTTLSYIPIKVSSISGAEGVSFTVLSGSDGSYSFYIPSESTCTLTGIIDTKNSKYYYDNPVRITNKEEKDANKETNFVANVKETEVVNSTGHDIKIDNTIIKANEHAKITAKSPVWKATLYYNEGHITSEAVIPISTTEITPSLFTDHAYSKLTLIGTTNEDIVTIRTIDNNNPVLYKTIVEGSQYLVENNKQLAIIITGSEGLPVYKIINLSEDSIFNVSEFVPYDLFNINGYVGLSKPGTLTVSSYNNELQSESKYVINPDGMYNINLPSSFKHKLSAHILVKDDHEPVNHVYSGQMLYENFESGRTYTRNLAVTSQEQELNGVTISNVHIDEIKDSEIKFNFMITNHTGKSNTLLVSAGSGWTDLTFYKADSLGRCTDEQINVTTVDKSVKIYAFGVPNKNTTESGSDGLSINVADIKNKKICTEMIDCDSNSNKTANKKSIIKYGTGSVADQEYLYSIKIKNCDNYTKTYKIRTNNIDDRWLQTLVIDNQICPIEANPIVHGYEEISIYIKITTADGSRIKVPDMDIEISRHDETFLLSSDLNEDTITYDSVTLKSTNPKIIVISNMSASGEGVSAEDIVPSYVWMLVEIVVISTIAVAWLSIRKGVFLRKK